MTETQQAGSDLAVTGAELELATKAIIEGVELEAQQPHDPEVVSRAILERILEAKTFEDIFKPQTLPSWRDNLGRPAKVLSFKLNPSSFEGGSSVYAVVDIVWGDTGENESVCCGGRNVMMQLVQALRHNLLPVDVQLSSKDTGAGNKALWLEAV